MLMVGGASVSHRFASPKGCLSILTMWQILPLKQVTGGRARQKPQCVLSSSLGSHTLLDLQHPICHTCRPGTGRGLCKGTVKGQGLPGPSSVQLLSRGRLFATPWTAARQASLSISNAWSLLKLMSIESVMPSNHLILCHPLLLPPSIFPSIRVFSNESVLHIRWPKFWSFSFSISPSNEYSELISLGWTGWISLQSKGLSRVFSNTTVQKHQFFGTQLSL